MLVYVNQVSSRHSEAEFASRSGGTLLYGTKVQGQSYPAEVDDVSDSTLYIGGVGGRVSQSYQRITMHFG